MLALAIARLAPIHMSKLSAIQNPTDLAIPAERRLSHPLAGVVAADVSSEVVV